MPSNRIQFEKNQAYISDSDLYERLAPSLGPSMAQVCHICGQTIFVLDYSYSGCQIATRDILQDAILIHEAVCGREQFGEYPTFSHVVSQVMLSNYAACEGYKDIQMWGAPSECCGLVSKAMLESQRRILKAAEMTPAQYEHLLGQRLPGKWIYQHPETRIDDSLLQTET